MLNNSYPGPPWLRSPLLRISKWAQLANEMSESAVGKVPVPFPQKFVEGIDLQKRDFENRMWSYLCGEWRLGGWWYYYLYAMLVKMPIGTQILIMMGILVPFLVRLPPRWKDEMILLAPSVCVIVLVSSQTGFNHHLRYVLPAFPGLYILGSKLFSLRGIPASIRNAARGALVAAICSSVFVWPHSRSYFNEVIGGPQNGHWHLGGSMIDTNIDCGQDLLFLKEWMVGHSEASPITLIFNGAVPPQIAGIDVPSSEPIASG